MSMEVLGVTLQIAVMVGLAWPLDKYTARVYKGERTCFDFMKPVERLMYKLSSVNSDEEMGWKKFLRTPLVVNLLWPVWGMVLLVTQGVLPLSPGGNVGQTYHQAFNICISLIANCNLQYYSGESGLTYFMQLFVIMLFQLITAVTGMAAVVSTMKGLAAKATQAIGNFWRYLVLSTTRILLPLSLVVGMTLIVEDIFMGFDGKVELTTLGGQEQEVSQDPTTTVVSIKQLGANGGGYFGMNSSHPLESPTYLINIAECYSILITPMALAFAFGFYLKHHKLGYNIFGVMLSIYLIGVGINMYQEVNDNPRICVMGTAQNGGTMEGKEVRIGSVAGALWSVTTTITSNGSANSTHGSTMPLSGAIGALNMQINTRFGGADVGRMNYLTFLTIAVFISGPIVERTPGFLGHKMEACGMKIASMVALLHPSIILVGTALAAYLLIHALEFVAGEGGRLNNPGCCGLSEMPYEYTSSAANNGPGFEGLGDSTWSWNHLCGIVLILGRFVPIVDQVAAAGIPAKERYIPESTGALKTDTATFGVMAFAAVLIVAALSFFPVHALSIITEHLTLWVINNLFEKEFVITSIKQSFVKLDPRQVKKSPVMSTMEIRTIIILPVTIYLAFNSERGSLAYNVWVLLILFITLLFANFAETIAKTRGEAQVDSLHRAHEETPAKLYADGNIRTASGFSLKKDDESMCDADDVIPADGKIVEGLASTDKSIITGGPTPAIREAGGDKNGVTGGIKVFNDHIRVVVITQLGESFLDKMIVLVKGVSRQRTPNEIVLIILLAVFTLVFLMVCVTLRPFADYMGIVITIASLLSLFVCLIPITIGGLLSAVGTVGVDRMLRVNAITKSGEAVEIAGDVGTLLPDRIGTITTGNRKATALYPTEEVDKARLE